jgi:peptidoglycan biosynthesis protein MviN/MurJ (putative lipid II flippase)
MLNIKKYFNPILINSMYVAVAQALTGLFSLGTQIVATRRFGVNDITDGFYIAYIFPDIIGNILLSLSLLVLLPRIVGDKNALSPYGRNLCWMFVLIVSALLFLLAFITLITAPLLAEILGPGLSRTGLLLATDTLKILTPMIIFQGVSGIFIAVLQANNNFKFASLGRLLFVVFPFLASITIMEKFGIISIAWAASFGSLLAFIYLFFIVKGCIGRPNFKDLSKSWSGATLVLNGIIPVLLARCQGEAWGFIVRAIATTALTGGATILMLVQKLTNVLNLIGRSMATVVYPDIARQGNNTTEGFIVLTRKRAMQIFTAMSLLSWPLAGIATPVIHLFITKTTSTASEVMKFAPVSMVLFALMSPWVSINNLIGNATWAIGQVWKRLILEFIVLFALLPVIWLGVKCFGFLAVPVVFFVEWIILVLFGELLLRKGLGQPIFTKDDVFQWLIISGIGILGWSISWFVCKFFDVVTVNCYWSYLLILLAFGLGFLFSLSLVIIYRKKN